MVERIKDNSQVQSALLCFLLLVLILISLPLAISLGSFSIDMQQVYTVITSQLLGQKVPSDIPNGNMQIIWALRLPRALLACLAGAGLAIAGLTLQTITRNPLSDPHLLGVSSGAVLGAVIVTLHAGNFLGELTLPIAAFLGALLATFVVMLASQRQSLRGASHLLMCGVAISFVLMSAANFALFLGDARAAHQVIFWMLGGLGAARLAHLWAPFAVCLAGFIFLRLHAKHMNALLLGDETAESLGVHVKALRIQLFIVSSLVTAVLVANTGAIGFIGLIVPHIGRYFVGGDIRRLLPFSAFFGALLLLWFDVFSRIILSPEELPIGIVTGIVGGLFFVILLLREER